MIEIGKIQKLKIKDFKPQGAYLGLDNSYKEVLLPKEEVKREFKRGDKLEVIVYKDSDGKLKASLKKPKGEVGEITSLKVTSKPKFGTFLDWGLDKDVFLPYSETIGSVSEGQVCLVALYLDKSGMVCASMKLENFLRTDSPYKKGDTVRGTVYSVNKKLGIFVAVDNKYAGLIPNEDVLGVYTLGDELEARVFNVKDDGKLDLSLTGRLSQEMSKDVNKILEKLKENGGFLPYNDKSDAEEIKKEFGISKVAFKKAIGNLYRERMIQFKNNGIKLI